MNNKNNNLNKRLKKILFGRRNNLIYRLSSFASAGSASVGLLINHKKGRSFERSSSRRI